MDPFAGSGTILLETLVNPHFPRSASGIEINPLARLISRVKTTPLSTHKLEKIHQSLNATGNSTSVVAPHFENIEMWFSDKSRQKLGMLLSKILELSPGKYRDFFLVCFSRIIRDCSLADPNVPPPVVLKPWKYRNDPTQHRKMLNFHRHSKDPDVEKLFNEAVKANLARMKAFINVLESNKYDVSARIIWDDAQDAKTGKYQHTGGINKNNAITLPPNSVNGIITSPPYLTAQKYVRSTKLELLWLGLANDKSLGVLERVTIGSERAHFKYNMGDTKGNKHDLLEIYSKEMPILRHVLTKITKESIERALEVGQYFSKMQKVLQEMYRILNKDAHAVIVLGDSKVNGHPFRTHKYLTDFAEQIGFRLRMVLRDPIRTRGMWIGRNSTGGRIEDEFIILLQR